MCIPFFLEVISRCRVSPDPVKVKALMDMLPPKTKRELQSFLGIVSYLSKFKPMTAEVCKPLHRLTSFKSLDVKQNISRNIQKGQILVKEDTCMKYYDVRKPLYLKNEASGLALGITLLHVQDNLNCEYDTAPYSAMLWPIAFARKNISSMEQ